MITKIISGGQTGADRGGLDAAVYAGIQHGGWCPKGRRAEDGVIPAIYELTECHATEYVVRTERNVVDADATIIITDGLLDGGSLVTAKMAEKHHKPWLHIDLREWQTDLNAMRLCSYRNPELTRRIGTWLTGWADGSGGSPKPPADCILNVAGQRESEAPGLQHLVKLIIVHVLIETRSSICYAINDEG